MVRITFFIAVLTVASQVSARNYPPLQPGSVVAIAPVGGNATSDKQLQNVIQTVGRLFIELGHTILSPNEIKAQLVELETNPCPTPFTCDEMATVRALKADALVSIIFWVSDDKPEKISIHIARPDNWGQAIETFEQHGFDKTIRATVALALSETQKSHEVEVVVRSTLRLCSSGSGVRMLSAVADGRHDTGVDFAD